MHSCKYEYQEFLREEEIQISPRLVLDGRYALNKLQWGSSKLS